MENNITCESCRYFCSDDDNCCPGEDTVCFEYSVSPFWKTRAEHCSNSETASTDSNTEQHCN